jgi:hypothetical protein
MRVSLASTADLYREHRRSQSAKKKSKVAAELQRRHDEQNYRPGYPGTWWQWEGFVLLDGERVVSTSGGHWQQITRFDFSLLP